ncbi:DUF7260 family protein [Haloplanus halobius]|uniref:DUF7260 family protein n=1 Tax=Haloplanus halobius TaxID=2934938 RepID=UPI0020101CDE|nr:hypothetical protein [Haloplanus sp. XH21]
MAVETHVDQARSRVNAERAAVVAKRDAFETFRDRVAGIAPEPTPSLSSGISTTAGAVHGESSTDDRCRTVRTAFAETVRPHSVDDAADAEPLLATIRAEFTDSIAVALAPTTAPPFSAELKRAIVAETTARQAEIETLDRALERERAQLDDAGTVLWTVTDWIADANETPLSALGFDTLRKRHETLAAHRDRCADLTEQRQAFLRETTTGDAGAEIHHRDLVPYLYGESPVDYPVLTTATRLDDVCAACQRTVRDHLVRRA